jgi:hypothetical protein
LHGYLHERSNEIDKDDELYWLGRGLDAYRKHIGTGPRGWRAPSFAFSKHSLRYLLEAKFEYDSSLMGDDVPYALKDGNASLLEFPVDWTLDDFPHYAHNRDLGYRMPISPPQRAMEVFCSEFDAPWKFGALWISVWHPALSGRLARFKAVLELLDYMRAKGGVWFARLDQVCDDVQKLMTKGRWTPRYETFKARSPNSPKSGKPRQMALLHSRSRSTRWWGSSAVIGRSTAGETMDPREDAHASATPRVDLVRAVDGAALDWVFIR